MIALRQIGALALMWGMLLGVPFSALAETTAPNVNQRELQVYFGGFAKMLGCTKNTFTKFSAINIGEMEFLPEDQHGANWSQLFTATIQILPDNEKLSIAAINGFASNLLNNYARHATIVDSKSFKASDGTPVIYMEYEIRDGLLREHGVGVYGRHTNTLAAFTRYEVRGRNLSESEIDVMRNLASTLTQTRTP